MATAGYSGTALIQKLGIRPGMKVLLLHPPENYFQFPGSDISGQYCTAKQVPALIHLFAKDNRVFESEMKMILPLCKKNVSVIIWVSWYKKSAGIPTDITEDSIRNFALRHELVDIKVCAVSNEWSGLKLVVPVSKR
ncbi:MAG TPA: hypothetical protein VK498_09645 [Ferruginibacter sp.]|nr:hypothetical protein [Ferruginibacter sp.]